MLETKSKEIDEFKISVTQWPARKAFKYKRKLGYYFGPALGEITAGLADAKKGDIDKSDSLLDSDFDLSKIGSAFEKLFDRLKEDDIDDIFRWMFSGVRESKKELSGDDIDVMFAGKMSTIYKIFGFVLEVNFGSFLDGEGIGSWIRKKMKK